MFESFFTSDWLLTFDMKIYQVAEQFRGPVFDKIMIFFTHMGDGGYFWIALSIVLLLFKKTRKIGLAMAGAIAFASLMNSLVLKHFFDRQRPYIMDISNWQRVATDGWMYEMPFESLKEKSVSFPSGHTATSFAAAIGIFYVDKKKGIIPLIVAALIGFSRIYIHVHYPSDVVAGVITGVGFGLLACVIIFKVCGGLLDKLNEKCKYKLFPAEGEEPDASVDTEEYEYLKEVKEEPAEESGETAEETEEPEASDEEEKPEDAEETEESTEEDTAEEADESEESADESDDEKPEETAEEAEESTEEKE